MPPVTVRVISPPAPAQAKDCPTAEAVIGSSVIVWVAVAVFPQASVVVHVMVVVVPEVETVPGTVPEPSQLSVQPKSPGVGIPPAQATVRSAGGVSNTGASVSSMVIV